MACRWKLLELGVLLDSVREVVWAPLTKEIGHAPFAKSMFLRGKLLVSGAGLRKQPVLRTWLRMRARQQLLTKQLRMLSRPRKTSLRPQKERVTRSCRTGHVETVVPMSVAQKLLASVVADQKVKLDSAKI